MSKDLQIIKGIPEGVRRASAEFSDSCGIAARLIKEPQMARVWNIILGRNINKGAVISLSQEYRCSNEAGLDERNIALAALFFISIGELTDITQFNSKENAKAARLYTEIAADCSMMRYIKFVSRVDEYIGDMHPGRNPEVREALNIASAFFDKLADALKRPDNSVRWDHQNDPRIRFRKTAWESALKYSDLPYVWSTSAIKARVSALIERADAIYETRLTAPLATIASVVLNEQISVKYIENCRRLLDRHRGPQSTRPS